MQAREMTILNSKEVKEIEEMINKNYGVEMNLRQFLVMKDSREKIWIASREVSNFDLRGLPINSIGMNLGKIKRDGLNLTVEGCQMVGRGAERNIVEVDERNAEEFMRGKDIADFKKINCDSESFVIVKIGNDFLGTGLLKSNIVENFLPKSRKIQ